jgi:hypothetical protein
MTEHDVIALGGAIASTVLLGGLAAVCPYRRKPQVACSKKRVDEECTWKCLRSCHLVTAP